MAESTGTREAEGGRGARLEILDWPDDRFDREMEALRMAGDGVTGGIDADAVAASLFGGAAAGRGEGRLGYNRFLDCADELMREPELALIAGSAARKRLEAAPEPFRYCFEPAEAPDWVDADKLQRAGEVWERYGMGFLLVLYAASLPSCYLIKRGIPALYDSGKLREAAYISQRLYETALMIHDVMRPAGLRVVRDLSGLTGAEVLAQALNRMDPGAQWEAGEEGVARSGPGRPGAEAHGLQAVAEAVRNERDRGARCYLWGPGFLSTRKVRILHASMRWMLLHGLRRGVRPPSAEGERHRFADRLREAPPWDTEGLGLPVNQEDQAFTLLTFGYVLTRGIAHWGCRLDRGDREAVLHLWKVVGYVLGVRTELTTDRWEEAEELYQRLLRREAAASEQGRALTGAVIGFVQDYLPAPAGLSRALAVRMIEDQIGPEQAAMVTPEEDVRAGRSWLARLAYPVFRFGLAYGISLADRWPARIPFFGPSLLRLFERVSEELIGSFREAYRRQPFYVPSNAETWRLSRGATPELLEALRNWRKGVFSRVLGGLFLVVSGALVFPAGVVLVMVDVEGPGLWTAAAGAALMAGGWAILSRSLPRHFEARPSLPSL